MRTKLLDIEVPLNDAIDFVQALRLIGQVSSPSTTMPAVPSSPLRTRRKSGSMR
jgi:hypothetical protein